MGLAVTGSQGSDELQVTFDGGHKVVVDLSRMNLTSEQRGAVDRLIDRAGRIEDAQCVDGRCPAQDFLEPNDFAAVRNLKASLGTTTDAEGIAAWIIIDFCIHPIIHRDVV